MDGSYNPLHKALNLEGHLALLYKTPVLLEWLLVQLGPSLYEALLSDRQSAGQLDNRVNPIDRLVFTVPNVKMRNRMRITGFPIHAEDKPQERVLKVKRM
jgi:hypothetical protein